MANTHYALLLRDTDERPNEIEFLAGRDEESCWQTTEQWTATHPLQAGEHVEVLTRTAEQATPTNRRSD